MKNASAALISLLSVGSGATFVQADLYTITLASGTVYYLTSASIDLTIPDYTGANAHTYLSTGAKIVRSATKATLDVVVDEVDIIIESPVSSGLGALFVAGGFDGATVLIEKFISSNWKNTNVGRIYHFSGRVSESTVDRSKISMKVVSWLWLLNLQMPRNTYNAGCIHALYDAGCTLIKSTFTVTGAVAAPAPLVSSCNTNLTGHPDGYFAKGVITFTSGVNSGLQRTVNSYLSSGGNTGWVPSLPAAPGVGDTFSIYPGCDHTFSGGCTKFSNTANYRGYEFVPQPTLAT
jgi:uncharacterized phage protein (TIGR02218 family)